MATETKTRGRVWEHKETLLLLEKWGDENIQLKLKSCTRKKPIWLEIAAYLRAAGYEDRDDSSCKTRIHTLISAYRSYKDECTKTGNATPKKKPAFFDEVDELMSDKPCTKPKVIIKSATISIDGDGDGEKTKAENVEPNVNIPGSSNERSENLEKPFNCVTAVTGKSYKMLSDWRARQYNGVQKQHLSSSVKVTSQPKNKNFISVSKIFSSTGTS